MPPAELDDSDDEIGVLNDATILLDDELTNRTHADGGRGWRGRSIKRAQEEEGRWVSTCGGIPFC